MVKQKENNLNFGGMLVGSAIVAATIPSLLNEFIGGKNKMFEKDESTIVKEVLDLVLDAKNREIDDLTTDKRELFFKVDALEKEIKTLKEKEAKQKPKQMRVKRTKGTSKGIKKALNLGFESKQCVVCGLPFIRKNENNYIWNKKKYCSNICKTRRSKK